MDRLTIKAIGATNIFDALEKAFELAGTGHDRQALQPAVDTILFMSDGAPNRGRIVDPSAIIAEIARMNEHKKVCIHTIGVGKDHDAELMKRIARLNGGTYVAASDAHAARRSRSSSLALPRGLLRARSARSPGAVPARPPPPPPASAAGPVRRRRVQTRRSQGEDDVEDAYALWAQAARERREGGRAPAPTTRAAAGSIARSNPTAARSSPLLSRPEFEPYAVTRGEIRARLLFVIKPPTPEDRREAIQVGRSGLCGDR